MSDFVGKDPKATTARGASGGARHEPGQAAPGGASGEPAADRQWAQQRIGNAFTAWRKAKGDAGAGAEIPRGGGAPLAGEVRSKMEPKLGADLSNVQVHTGGDSAKAAEGMGARAFTVGSSVHFGQGEFQPGSKEGDRLIAHELTHVVQGQGQTEAAPLQRKADAGGGGDEAHAGHEVSHPEDASEREADAVADRVTEGIHGEGAPAAGPHGAADKGAPAAGAAAKPAAPISAKRLPGISLAPKAGAAPARNNPAGGGANGAGPAKKVDPAETALKQSIDALKRVVEEPLKLSAAELDQLLRTTWKAIGYEQGPLQNSASTLAKQALQAWDGAKAKYIAARFDGPITMLSPEHPNCDQLLPAVLQLIEKEQPSTSLFLPKTTEALLHSKSLVKGKQDAHKQAVAAKEAEKKKEAEQKKQQGGGHQDEKHDVGPHGDGPAAGGGKKADHGSEPLAPPTLKNPQKGIKVADVHAAEAATDKAAKPTSGADKAAAPAAPEKPAVAPEPKPEELLAHFKTALGAKDAAKAEEGWKKVPASHRGLVSAEEVVAGYLLNASLGAAMHLASLNPFAVNYAILESAQAPKALAAIHSTAQWTPFVLLAPTRGALTKKHQAALRPLVAGDKKTAQEIFEKAFGTAHDGPYPGPLAPTTLATPWALGALVRLYDALYTAGLPAAHLGAVGGGYYLVSKELNKGVWEESTGAWYDDSIKACAFGTGAVAYTANLNKNKDKKEAHNANEGYMPFFEGAALHEVGHAVGDTFGGNAWAVQRNDFKAENGNSWSKALFNYTGKGGGVGSKLKNFFKGKKNIKPEDARAFMIGLVNGAEVLPPGVDDQSMREALRTEYKDTILYKYAAHLVNGHQGYQFPELESCVHDGRLYYENKTFQALGFASRFVSCKPETVTARVSTYSLASHKEWFAENYMAYYKTPKALGSKVASDVKGYLDTIHKNPEAGKVVQAGGKSAAPGKSAAEKKDEEKGTDDAGQGALKEAHVHRFSFPFNAG